MKNRKEADRLGAFRFWRYFIVLGLVIAALGIPWAALYVNNHKAVRTVFTGPDFLEVRNAATGRIIRQWPLGDSAEFSIEFIHSVNQSPVTETFKIENGMIRPWSVRFSSFGAGMATGAEEGQVLSRDGDEMIITGFKNSLQELNYIVGTVSDHLLKINGETVSLRDLCGKNARIQIRIKQEK